ncbi:MAG: ribose-5-phosphate isomerase RpiA [Candidatus Bathyarchaeia archaeon]
MKGDRLEAAKRAAAERASALVRSGQLVGLGSGSTIALVVEALAKRVVEEGLRAEFVPSSYQIQLLAMERGLRVVDFLGVDRIDLAIDGADQVDRDLNLVKGKGGALTREKILDAFASELVIVVDEGKLSDRLGVGQPIPIEILPFALPLAMREIKRLGGRPSLRLGTGKVGPVVTDNGGFILDADFGPIDDPKRLDADLRAIPGVVETGIFAGMAHEVYVGRADGTVEILRR